MELNNGHKKGVIPYALTAFLIGIVGGFSTVLAPAFVQDIGISYNNTAWTALAQAMSTAACAPILGKVGDIIGRKIALLSGIGIFTLGNALSALANSLVIMLAARFIVGVGTAAMAPVIMAYIVTQFPGNHVAKGFSLVQQKLLNFDGFGAVMVLLFFSLMLCIPSFGQNFGWSSTAFVVVLIAAVVSLAGLVAAEKHAVHPILPGSFMKRRAFILCAIQLFLTQGLMQANMTNTIVFNNYTQPENSVISGHAISVMYLFMSLGAVILGPMADRLEPKHILTGSLILTGIGCGMMFLFSATTSSLILMASLGILGFG